MNIPKSPAYKLTPAELKVAPSVEPSPARKHVPGVTDTIDNLQKYVAASNLHDGVKAYLATELGLIKTNAATLHLHDVSMPEGGFNLHVTLKPFTLGAVHLT